MSVDLAAPILVVDDHPGAVSVVKLLLQRLGFTAVEGVTDGVSAWKRLQDSPCALVISDWNMSPTSGLDLLLKLRERSGKSIPFMMITGENSAERVIEARRAGADNFLVKPFDMQTFKAGLTEVLGPF